MGDEGRREHEHPASVRFPSLLPTEARHAPNAAGGRALVVPMLRKRPRYADLYDQAYSSDSRQRLEYLSAQLNAAMRRPDTVHATLARQVRVLTTTQEIGKPFHGLVAAHLRLIEALFAVRTRVAARTIQRQYLRHLYRPPLGNPGSFVLRCATRDLSKIFLGRPGVDR